MEATMPDTGSSPTGEFIQVQGEWLERKTRHPSRRNSKCPLGAEAFVSSAERMRVLWPEHPAQLLTVCVDNSEVIAQVAEERAEEAMSRCHDETAASFAANLVYTRGFSQGHIRDDHNAECADEFCGELAGVLLNRNVPMHDKRCGWSACAAAAGWPWRVGRGFYAAT